MFTITTARRYRDILLRPVVLDLPPCSSAREIVTAILSVPRDSSVATVLAAALLDAPARLIPTRITASSLILMSWFMYMITQQPTMSILPHFRHAKGTGEWERRIVDTLCTNSSTSCADLYLCIASFLSYPTFLLVKSDNDNDCDSGLICHQRTGTTAVYGCTGGGISGKDYCSIPLPPTEPPTKAPTPICLEIGEDCSQSAESDCCSGVCVDGLTCGANPYPELTLVSNGGTNYQECQGDW